ncbi:hypothetical protein [Yersinia massiliensis]|uniref:hypothetical protein n=1 Tax=Yersinia massiliensis TaxID=419257 RepID=UPI0002E45805|nr:hypothetical protein [Yersinia massiliensis]MCB5309689.1 hypothetical protein [Yersinia massiliensis]
MLFLPTEGLRAIISGAGLLLGSLLSFDALALECHLGTVTGTVNDYEDIGALKIPTTLPVGSRLWTSKSFTRTLACWAYKSVESSGEMSYFYPNPAGGVIGEGIGIGIIYNGLDLGVIANGGTTASRVSTGSWVNPGPSGIAPPAKPTLLNITVQLYLEKTGDITGGIVGVDSLRVFQIDGVGGVNSIPNSNYGLTLSGLHNIEVMQCSAIITVSHNNYVEFGPVKSWNDASAGVVAESTFHVNASTDGGDDCDRGFDLNINFDAAASGNTLLGLDGMDMGNGSTLKIEDDFANSVNFNEFAPFIDQLTPLSGIVERVYTARLYASGPAVLGDTEKNIILRFNYN